MASKRAEPGPKPACPRIYEAERLTSGGVRKRREVSEAEAVELRRRGVDVVVCGGDVATNLAVAGRIEQMANGRWVLHRPHAHAGPQALPHFQPQTRSPGGHTFYETNKRKAR